MFCPTEFKKGGVKYVKPIELYRDTGQHSLSPYCCKELKESVGCIRPLGFTQDYGIGMNLYFKFVKTLNVAFFFATMAAFLAMSYYWSTSAWTDKQKSVYMTQEYLKYGFFYTTAGSLGGTTTVCGAGYEGERVFLSCQSGSIVRLEAYYGDPLGGCGCPPEQTISTKTGECPAQPSFAKDTPEGECVAEYGDEDDYTGVKPCFKGQMWNGDTCCAYGLNDQNSPEFSDLAMLPKAGCNSASAQYIAQGFCMGKQNCTIDVVSNRNYTWEVHGGAPCVEGEQRATGRPQWNGNRFHNDPDWGGPEAECTTTLDSPNSDLSSCPGRLADRRFVVRGICSSDTFQVDWIEGGREQSRREWALGLSWLDAVLTTMMFFVCIWMSEKEEAAVFTNDMVSCSADDYTLRLMHLAAPAKGKSANLDRLKLKIKSHFEELCKKAKPVIKERPVKVLDINFGMNNQDQLANMKVRGLLSRTLDLEHDKLTLMKRYHIHSEKEIYAQDVKVRLLKVKFLKICEAVKFRKQRLEARTAFVTFASEEGYERCRKAYARNQPGWCGQSRKLQLKLGSGYQTVKMKEVYRPSDYIWENLSTLPIVTTIKVIISNTLSLTILLIGLVCIIVLKDVEAKAKLALGSTDCTLYEFAYSGDPLWTSVAGVNATKAQVTRLDVVMQLFPEHYNVSFPEPGLLGCFCLDAKNYHVIESGDPGDTTVNDVEFRNPETGEQETLCGDFLSDYDDATLMSTFAVGAIVVVNEALKGVFQALVAFEGHETRTQEILAHTIKLFVAILMNTAFIIILISGNMNLFLAGEINDFTRVLDRTAILSGTISDFTSEWYLAVGTAILSVMFINAFALNSKVFQDFFKVKATRWLDRGFTCDMTRTSQKLQVQLEAMYTGPQMLLEERYAAHLVAFFVCVMFSAGMPVLWFIGWLSFWFAFVADKWAFIRLYRLPPKYSATLAQFATKMLPWAILVHAAIALWVFSVPELFDYQDEVVEGGLNVTAQTKADRQRNRTVVEGWIPYEGESTVDYWGPEPAEEFRALDKLYRVAEHENSLPHICFLLIFLLWFVLIRIIGVDDILYCLSGVCVKQADFSDVTKAKEGDSTENPVDGEAGRSVSLDDEPEDADENKKDKKKKNMEGGGGAGGDSVVAAIADDQAKKAEEADAARALADAETAAKNPLISDEDEKHAIDRDGTGAVVHENLKMSEAARIEYENMATLGPKQDDGESQEDYDARYKRFEEVYKKEKGVAGINRFFETNDGPTFQVAATTMDPKFRDDWLTTCEFIHKNRGRRKIEGNADYMWSIPTELIVKHIHLDVLQKEMLSMYRNELAFRDEHPELYARVTRRLQGLISYDVYANDDYLEAFALDSRAMKEYSRGNIQASGEDFELAQRGCVNGILRFMLGAPPLAAVFPDLTKDVHNKVATHTTAVGVTPDQITGPRFVVNLRVPPTPPDLTAQDFDDPDYDESAEKWQYMRLSVRDIFEYRVRIPRGLQHKKIPEIQMEVPCIEQTRSAVKTMLVGGERRSVLELKEDADLTHSGEEAQEGVDMSGSTTGMGAMSIENMGTRKTHRAAEKAHKTKRAEEDEQIRKAMIEGGSGGGGGGGGGDDAEMDAAATKIQSAVRGRNAKNAVKRKSRMRSWQAKTLQALEGDTATLLIVLIVIGDMYLTLNEGTSGGALNVYASYGCTGFFFFELCLRFHCYAYLSRGEGCELRDCDFFIHDRFRLLDLVIVVLDVLATLVLVSAKTGAADGIGFLKFAKSGRALRLARLLRLARVLRTLKILDLVDDSEDYILTGREKVAMQRFHMEAPEEVDKGNRLSVSIHTLGKVNMNREIAANRGSFHVSVA